MLSSIHHSIYLGTMLMEESSSEAAFPAAVLWILISASTCLWYWLALLSVFLLSLSSTTRTLDWLKSGRTGRPYVHKQQRVKKTQTNPNQQSEHNLLHSYSSWRMKKRVGTDLSRQQLTQSFPTPPPPFFFFLVDIKWKGSFTCLLNRGRRKKTLQKNHPTTWAGVLAKYSLTYFCALLASFRLSSEDYT